MEVTDFSGHYNVTCESASATAQSLTQTYLEVGEDVVEEIVDVADASLRPPRHEDELDSQQRDEDEGGPHRLHVGRGLGAVRLLQLGDQNTDDV